MNSRLRFLRSQVKTLKLQTGRIVILYIEVSDKLEDITKDRGDAEFFA